MRVLAVVATALVGLAMAGARAADLPVVPRPETGFIEQVPAAPCTPESRFDRGDFYGAKCKRLHFVFGPLLVKPGQNDVLIEPTTIEQPRYDGYMVRFEPNLVDTSGAAPPVEQLHLHHGTWLNLAGDYTPNGAYGSGPFMASGEEKTIAFWPKGYGMKVKHDDVWELLYMVHNATAEPRVVWITYDVDFVAAADAEAIQPDGNPLIRNTKNIWLDVGGSKFHEDAKPYLLNPVYNVQKGYGELSADGARSCSFPAANCASFNSAGNVSAQQGLPVNVAGMDWDFDEGFLGDSKVGTLVVMGGHLHPGGLTDKISLVRDGVERPILTSEAVYWDWTTGTKPGGPPTSWDFSMTGASADIGWRILVKEGDILRLNAEYETDLASWYENMGIVMTWVAPGDTSGIDVFDPAVTYEDAYPVGAQYPEGITPTCTPSATHYCLRGQVTHTQYPENTNHGHCGFKGTCDALDTSKEGPLVNRLDMGAFTYGLADANAIDKTGIPRVKVGQELTFVNEDTADFMWHTVTRCAFPCTGPTTVDYPIADGGLGIPGEIMDFDSSELGVGLSPAQRADWTIKPDKPGYYTFFCRIHPSMRGAFQAVE